MELSIDFATMQFYDIIFNMPDVLKLYIQRWTFLHFSTNVRKWWIEYFAKYFLNCLEDVSGQKSGFF